MKKLVVVGSSGHARVVLECIAAEAGREVVGLVDSFKKAGEQVGDFCILGDLTVIADLYGKRCIDSVVVAVGDNFHRGVISESVAAASPGIEFPSIVHPRAFIAPSAVIGSGSVILPGACVGTNVVVGKGCVLNSACCLEHDSVMEDYSSLAPGVITGGHCVVGEYAAICVGAVLLHRITVGNHAVVGAGSVVTDSVASLSLSYGVPARHVRVRARGEPYL